MKADGVAGWVGMLSILIFGLYGTPVLATDLTLPLGGRVIIEQLFSDAALSNTLLLQSPAAAIVTFGCQGVRPGDPNLQTALPLLSAKRSQRGCRIELDADPSTPGIQPFAAGTTLNFRLCTDTSTDLPCADIWSSDPAQNSDHFDHVRITPVHADKYPGQIYQLAWEDLASGGDQDFDDLIAVLRVDTAASPMDSDGDGLWDDWEEFGIDTRGDGKAILDLPALGADPKHKDIFLEIDYMVCDPFRQPLNGDDCRSTTRSHTHRPKAAAIQAVKDAFATAPVDNPDGKTGINLHVDVSNAVPHQNYLILSEDGCGDPTVDPAGVQPIGSFDAVKAGYFDADTRAFAFHYVLFGHRKSPTGRGRSSGCAEFPGNDLLVTLGDWNTLCVKPGAGKKTLDSTPGGDDIVITYTDGYQEIHAGLNLACNTTAQGSDANVTLINDLDGDGLSDLSVGTVVQQAGTLMHELGHNLGLQHGGDSGINNKPNYLSVMNYLFQTDGIPGNQQTVAFGGFQPPAIDYSSRALARLDETQLDETVGIQNGFQFRTRYFCPGGRIASGAGSGAIDWNCNGDGGKETSVNVNINGEVNLDANKNLIPLTGFNDWGNLIYAMQGAADFNDGSHGVLTQPVEETQDTMERFIPREVRIDITPAETPNSIRLRSTGTVPVAILSEPGFAANTQVQLDSLTFGASGDERSLARCDVGGEDVNGDNLPDLVCHFRISASGFQADSAQGILRGQTVDGKAFTATAPVRILSK